MVTLSFKKGRANTQKFVLHYTNPLDADEPEGFIHVDNAGITNVKLITLPDEREIATSPSNISWSNKTVKHKNKTYSASEFSIALTDEIIDSLPKTVRAELLTLDLKPIGHLKIHTVK